MKMFDMLNRNLKTNFRIPTEKFIAGERGPYVVVW